MRGIEGYRREYGVTDKKNALGEQGKGASQRAVRARAQRRMQETQRADLGERGSPDGRGIPGVASGSVGERPDPLDCGTALALVNPCGVGAARP